MLYIADFLADTADAEVRLQSAPSAQRSDVATAVSDSPILSKSPALQPEPQPVVAQSPVKAAAYQPTRFASEASQDVDVSTGDSAFSQTEQDSARPGISQSQPGATIARGLSDTPWLGGEGQQTRVDAPVQQQFVSQQSFGSVASSNGRQGEGFDSGSGRLQQPQSPGQGFVQQPQSPGQGFVQQPQDGGLGPGLSGVKQVWKQHLTASLVSWYTKHWKQLQPGVSPGTPFGGVTKIQKHQHTLFVLQYAVL